MSQTAPPPAAKKAPIQDAQAVTLQPVKPVPIVRGGDKIILPDGMSYEEGRSWLTKQEQAEEHQVEIFDSIPCFPLDGVVALMRALSDKYGFTELADTQGFWGPEPPTMVQVPAHNGFQTAALGRMKPPKWEGGYIEPHIPQAPALTITGKIKRKFENEVKEVISLTREKLKQSSIYRGHAVLMDLTFLDPNEDKKFHPVHDAPKFMDLSSKEELILNATTDFELATSVYMLLERTEHCEANRIKLKHGVLLSGTFGTGKTLTANVLARKAIQNNWTFIYLSRAQDLANGLRVAQLYSPAVLYAEDIDTVVDGDRDEQLNNLLNTLDGVDTKSVPIITVLTTNREDQISPAFMRAGRIDTVIKFSPPDDKTAVRFVQAFARDDQGRSLLVPGESLEEVGKAMAGLVPAFIAEAIGKAKRYAIYRHGSDILGKVTANDLLLAASSIRSHVEMTRDEKEPSHEERVATAVRLMDFYGEFGNLDGFNG